HNNRTKNPSEDPVNLESASVDDLLSSAATWERVIRKLAVRAMPPQGTPHPTEADFSGFTSWLAGSLDRAWEGKSNPGRYVVHRLNRAEYGNAIRDLLGLDVDVTEGLPSDGADFGFDNIATSLKTSPLLLERYLTTAQRVSAMAVGDPDVRAGNTEYSISREFTQAGHIDGLPLGTRGGTVARQVFPPDGEDTRLLPSRVRAERSRKPIHGHERGEGARRRAYDRTCLRHRRSARRGLHVERAAVAAAGCVAAFPARQPGNSHDRRSAEIADCERRGSVQREGRQQYSEPRANFHLPSGGGR